MFKKYFKRFLVIGLISVFLAGMILNQAGAGSDPVSEEDYVKSGYYLTERKSLEAYRQILEGFKEESAEVNGISGDDDQTVTEPEYPDYYGGAYINDDGKLVVLITKDSKIQGKEELNKNISDKIQLGSNYIIQECDVSFNELRRVQNLILEKDEMFESMGINITMTGISFSSGGKLKIWISDMTEEDEKVVRSYFDYDFLVFESGEECVNQVDLGGGYGVSDEDGYDSTIGFSAKLGALKGYVVSGHAGYKKDMYFKYNGKKIGTVEKTAYYNKSNADAAFVKSNGNFTPTNVLANAGTIWSADTTNLFAEGTTVWMYGKISKLQSGKITAVSVATKSEEDQIGILNQNVASYKSQNGDSGAPILYYDGNYGGKTRYVLLGVHKGRVSAGAVFSPYANIIKELGVTCITSS